MRAISLIKMNSTVRSYPRRARSLLLRRDGSHPATHTFCQKTCRVCSDWPLLFFLSLSFYFTDLQPRPSQSVGGRSHLHTRRVVGRTSAVLRRLMHSSCMGEHELEWGLDWAQYICWMMRWTHPRLLHLALMNKLRGRSTGHIKTAHGSSSSVA